MLRKVRGQVHLESSGCIKVIRSGAAGWQWKHGSDSDQLRVPPKGPRNVTSAKNLLRTKREQQARTLFSASSKGACGGRSCPTSDFLGLCSCPSRPDAAAHLSCHLAVSLQQASSQASTLTCPQTLQNNMQVHMYVFMCIKKSIP